MDGLLNDEMSRSISQANNKLFKKLFDYACIKQTDTLNRYIPISKEANQRRYFTHFSLNKEIGVIKPTVSSSFSLFTLNEENYLVFIGDLDSDIDQSELLMEEISVEVYLAILDELDIHVKKSVSKEKVLDYLLIGEDPTTYKGHDYDELLTLFPSFNLFRITATPSISLKTLLNKYAILYFTNNTDNNLLPFSNNTLQCYKSTSISLAILDIVPLDGILRSVNASSWSHCFLDIYKYLEYLFRAAKVHEHFTEFETNGVIGFELFYRYINSKVNKSKPTEEDAIIHLLSIIEETHKSILRGYKESEEQKEGGFIYKLRNDLVHFRPDTTHDINFNSEKWNAIILFLLSTIDYLYNKFACVVRL